MLTQAGLGVIWSPGFDGQASPGQAAAYQVGQVLNLLQLALDDDYEGTREINTLIVSRAITGLAAFV